MKTIKIFWIVLSFICALTMYFFMGDFYLKLVFTSLFVLIMVFLGLFLFSEDLDNPLEPQPQNSDRGGIRRLSVLSPSLLLYFLSLIFSLIVLATGQPQITIVNDSMFASYLSLTPLSILKLVSGLFLLSILPGWAVCRNFFKKESFSGFEKFGLSMAISFCINLLIGLLFVSLNLPLTSFGVIFSIWLFVLASEVIGRFSKVDTVKKPAIGKSRLGFCLMILVFLVLLLGAYSTTLAAGPVSGLTGGDIADYFTAANKFVYLNSNDFYIGVKFYLFLVSSVTGLPLSYIYPALQYLVLLVPISIYALLKGLFSDKKVAVIGTLFVSLMQGLSTLPFLTNLINSPALFQQYITNGATLQTLSTFVSTVEAGNTSTYALWVSTIETGLFFFALAFLFKYISSDKRKLAYLFVGALLLVGALYSHFLFLFLCFIGTIMIYSLLRHVSKFRLLELVGAIMLFMVPFEVLTKTPIYNQLLTFFIELNFSQNTIRAQSVYLYVFAVLATLTLYAILLFRGGIANKLGISSHLNIGDKFRSFYKIKKAHIIFFLIGFIIIIAAILIAYVNFDSLSVSGASASYVRPWFIWVLYWGLEIPLVLGTVLLVFKRFDKASLTLLVSLLFSVLGLAFLFYVIGPTVWATPSLLTKRYLFFMSFPLGCFAALGLVTLINCLKNINSCLELKPIVKLNVGKRLRRYSFNKKKVLGFLLTLILVTSIAASYLSYVYIDEYWIAASSNGAMSSSDAKVLEWMRNDLPSDTTVMALSASSYNRLCGILTSKIEPLFFNSTAPAGDIWPRRIIMDSQLPEAIFYGLNQLGVKYIFVGSDDAVYASSRFSTFNSLLNAYPCVYSSGNSKVVEVPDNYLFQDSNYHLVSDMWGSSLSTEDFSKAPMQQNSNIYFSEMLFGYNTPFTITPDSNLTTLKPGNVYIFPYNQRLPLVVQSNLDSLLNNGANVIFADSSFGSYSEVGQKVTSTSDIMNINQVNIQQANVTQIIFEDKSFNYTFPISLSPKIEGPNIQVIANYYLSNNASIPFIVTQKIGLGSLTFINLSPLAGCSNYQDILEWAKKELLLILPTPVSSDQPLSLPIPSELYTAFTGGTIEAWNNRGLLDNLLLENVTELSGNVVLNSQRIYINCPQLPIRGMQAIAANNRISLSNATLYNVELLGSGQIQSSQADLLLYNVPSGYSSNFETKQASSFTFNLSSAQISFRLNSPTAEDQVLAISNLTINSFSTPSLELRLEQPTITVNGNLTSLLQGAFLHENIFFRAFSVTNATISGDFSLQILYSSGITFAKIKVDALTN